jgi:hypothetical protein
MINRCNNEQMKQHIPPKLIKFLSEKLKLKEEYSLLQNLGIDHNDMLDDNLECEEPITNIEIDAQYSSY